MFPADFLNRQIIRFIIRPHGTPVDLRRVDGVLAIRHGEDPGAPDRKRIAHSIPGVSGEDIGV